MSLEDYEVRNRKPCQSENRLHELEQVSLEKKKNKPRRGWTAVFKYLKEKPVKAGMGALSSSTIGRTKMGKMKTAKRPNRAHPHSHPQITF